jgi:hypothetical protein
MYGRAGRLIAHKWRCPARGRADFTRDGLVDIICQTVRASGLRTGSVGYGMEQYISSGDRI